MTKQMPPETLQPQCRTLAMQVLRSDDATHGTGVDALTRTAQLAFSSEEPCDMWYGKEILSHAPGAMRMGVRQTTMPLLFNHNRDDLLGVVQGIAIDSDKCGRASVRYGKDERGEWAMKQTDDGVLVNVSFMYRVYKWLEDTEANTLTAVDWEVMEISLVTVPADPTVGVGRSADTTTPNGVQTLRKQSPAPATTASPTQSPVLQPLEQPMKFSTPPRRQESATDTGTDTGGTGTGTTPAVPSSEAGNSAAVAQQRGAEAERARISEIEALAKRYNLSPELRTQMIQRGATVEQARLTAADVVLERAQQSGKKVADFGETHNPDLTPREAARYSMIRAVNAAISGKWDQAGFELECSNEIAKRSGRQHSDAKAFFVPTNLQGAMRAAYATGASSTGGALVPTNLLAGSFIEVLRNQARVLQLGATMLSGLVGNVDIPRQTGQTNTFWTAEGVDTSEGEASFDKVSLSMKTIGTYSLMTRQMLMQGTPDIDMIARADMLRAMALGIDLAALSGSGSGAIPRGIANVSGIGSVIGGVNGGALTIDNMIDLETSITSANAPETNLAYLTNAKAVGALKKLKSTTGQYLWTGSSVGAQSGTPGEINGYPVARSNQARSNLTKGTASGICSEVFFGAWSELLIGEWGVLEIVPNPYAAEAYKNGGVLLRALQSLDIGVRHAASFATISDALT